ncbi:Z-ring formation inhibitor MciZ [Paenibacillus sp. DMB20]|uniref:Z-ring formation inhibitor MciZ n=1 Tax=Paenibacillus sp. DMB20 TaxID=1642570 RepID=UPI0009E64B71|nr:Z-ring formation inhibitor MciZ [Paenibacillus sp. DMB20]
MKSYQGSKSVHLVGQAWQIRALLKQWQRQWGPEVTISELLRKNDADKYER